MRNLTKLLCLLATCLLMLGCGGAEVGSPEPVGRPPVSTPSPPVVAKQISWLVASGSGPVPTISGDFDPSLPPIILICIVLVADNEFAGTRAGDWSCAHPASFRMSPGSITVRVPVGVLELSNGQWTLLVATPP